MASRAWHIEFHPPAGLRHLARAVALGTLAGSLLESLAAARGAGVLPRNVEPHDAAADRRPERHVNLILEIGTRLGAFLLGGGAATTAEAACIGPIVYTGQAPKSK